MLHSYRWVLLHSEVCCWECCQSSGKSRVHYWRWHWGCFWCKINTQLLIVRCRGSIKNACLLLLCCRLTLHRTDISTYNCYMYLKYRLMQEPSMKRTCFNMHSVHVIVVYLKISWCRNRPFTIFVLGLWWNRGYCEDWYLGWRLFHLHQCCESFELLCWGWNCHHCPLRQVCSYLCIMFQGQMRDFFFPNMFDHLTLSSTRKQHTVHDKEMFWNFSFMHTGFWFSLQADHHYQHCSTSVSLSSTKFELFGKACQREVCKGSGTNNDCQTPCRALVSSLCSRPQTSMGGKKR